MLANTSTYCCCCCCCFCPRNESEAKLSLAWAIGLVLLYSRGAFDFPIFYAFGPHFRRECNTMLREMVACCRRTYRSQSVGVAAHAERVSGASSTATLRTSPRSTDTLSMLSMGGPSPSRAVTLAMLHNSLLWSSTKVSRLDTFPARGPAALETASTGKHPVLPIQPPLSIFVGQNRFSTAEYRPACLLTPIKEMSTTGTTVTTTSLSTNLSSSEESKVSEQTSTTNGVGGSTPVPKMSPIEEFSANDDTSVACEKN